MTKNINQAFQLSLLRTESSKRKLKSFQQSFIKIAQSPKLILWLDVTRAFLLEKS